jgi:hypothetical protein
VGSIPTTSTNIEPLRDTSGGFFYLKGNRTHETKDQKLFNSRQHPMNADKEKELKVRVSSA